MELRAPTPGQQMARIADQVGELLRHLKETGQQTVEMDPARLRGLGRYAPAAPGTPPAAAAAPESLAGIARRIAVCTLCPLHESRTRTVPGQGCPSPEIAFVGEGPGADEDQQGLAFVGRAGQLLTRIIEAMGLRRDQVWIGNIVKCRPPGNRTPMPEEMAACLPYLREQMAVLRPKVIVCLGATAVKGLLDVSTGITRLRGTWMTCEGVPVMPTYHPAYLLRNPAGKRDVWEDMKTVLASLGRTPPPRPRSPDLPPPESPSGSPSP